jgi:hypothetical protein
MSAGVRIEISERGQELIRRYGDVTGMLKAVQKRFDLENQLTLGEIKEKRLTGDGGDDPQPFPPSEHRLNRRTSKLVEAARVNSATITGNTVWTSLGTMGSSVRYAILHEKGWTGMVAPHIRSRTKEQQKLVLLGAEKVTKAGNTVRKRVKVTAQGKDVFVGGYKMTIPARAPFITGIRDRLPATAQGISEAVVEYYGGKS